MTTCTVCGRVFPDAHDFGCAQHPWTGKIDPVDEWRKHHQTKGYVDRGTIMIGGKPVHVMVRDNVRQIIQVVDEKEGRTMDIAKVFGWAVVWIIALGLLALLWFGT